MIHQGHLKAGDHVSHRPLARRLGISTIPVMQGLRTLEGRGVLVRDRRGVTRVRCFTPKEIYATLALREAAESTAARFCAEDATDEELAVFHDTTCLN